MKKLLIALLLLLLIGCQQENVANKEIDTTVETSTETENITVEDTTVEDTPVEESIKEVRLPEKGEKIEDFIPEGWVLLDSITLDFNEDGLVDIVGVLDMKDEEGTPRILFALENKSDQYELSFENKNLVETSYGGGAAGDPYLPLTTDGKSFTVNEKGGSAWGWAQLQTFEYSDEWYLIKLENIGYNYSFDELIVYKKVADYNHGLATFDYNSRSFEDIEGRGNESEPYDLSFELSLGKSPTLGDWAVSTYSARTNLNFLPVEMISGDYEIEDEALNDLHERVEALDTEFALCKKIIDDVEHLILYNRDTHNVLLLDSKENPADKSYGNMRRLGDSVYFIKFEEDSHAILYKTDLNGDVKETIGEWSTSDFEFFHVGFQFYDDQILVYITIDNMNYYQVMNLDGTDKEDLGQVKGHD